MMSNNEESGGRRTAIDRAIDHAVRRMMHVDPRPGLQQRVLARLRGPRAAASLVPRLAFAAGTLAIIVTAVLLIPRGIPRNHSAVPPASVASSTHGASTPPVMTPAAEEPAAGTQVQTPAKSAAPERRKPATTDTVIRMPEIADVFGERSGKVSAANVAPDQAQQGQTKTDASAQSARPAAQLSNIRLDVTVTEQRDSTAIPPRTVTLLLADRETGRVRTSQATLVMNVDARAEIVREGRIRVWFVLEYRGLAMDSVRTPAPIVNQTVTTLLEDGKPIVVSQSADAARSGVRVELKATILK